MNPEVSVSLHRYSTLHVGGAATYLLRISTIDALREALDWAEQKSIPWFILGGGSNFFCRDEGFSGLVIKMENRALEFMGNVMTAEAGVVTRLAVVRALDRGLRGMEHLAGIPGTIGGAVRGNAGAFGQETKDRILRARLLVRTTTGWEEKELLRDDLFFAYRDSAIKRAPKKNVIWSASFALVPGDTKEGERLIAQDLADRKALQPYEHPSVGSIFLNPSSSPPVGKLLEDAGLKGVRVGAAEVSTKHANFIVNRGDATARDVQTLIQRMKRRVFDSYGVKLEEEIVLL